MVQHRAVVLVEIRIAQAIKNAISDQVRDISFLDFPVNEIDYDIVAVERINLNYLHNSLQNKPVRKTD